MKRVSALRRSVRRAVSRGEPGDDLSEDALASFRGVSLLALQELCARVGAGREAAGVELAECLRASRRRGLKRGQSVEVVGREGNFLVCRSPFWGEPTSRKARAGEEAPRDLEVGAEHDDIQLELGREVRVKARSEWTLEDVCQFVVIPAMRPRRGGVYSKDALEGGAARLGQPFEGAYVSAPRSTKLKVLVDALLARYAGCDPASCFVWVDILCANQVRAKAGRDDPARAGQPGAAEEASSEDARREDEETEVTRELLRRVRAALGRFDERLLFFKSWMDPVPLTRSWCIFEVLAGMELESPFHILSSADEETRFSAALQHNPQSVIRLCGVKFDVAASRCRNRLDRQVLEAVIGETYGSESNANDAFNACVRAWLAESTLVAVEAKRASIEPGDAIAWFGALLHRAGQLVAAAGDYTQARAFYQEALDVSRRELGNRNARVARLLCDLAVCQQRLGFPDEAMEAAAEALPMLQAKFGDKHRETASLLRSMAEIAMQQQERQMWSAKNDKEAARRSFESAFKSAAGYYEQAIDIYRAGRDESDKTLLAGALNNAAHVCVQAGKYAEAVSYCEEALSIYKDRFGASHPKLAPTYSNIGEIYRIQNMAEEAQEQYDCALEIYFEDVYQRHAKAKSTLDQVLEALCSKSASASSQKALERLGESSGSLARALRDMNPQVLPVLEQKAELLLSSKARDLERGLVHLSVALGVAQQVHGRQTEQVAEILEKMATVFSDLKNLSQSVELSARALEIRKTALGAGHPVTKQTESTLHGYERRRSLLDKNPPACV